jgi:hypothetical protein
MSEYYISKNIRQGNNLVNKRNYIYKLVTNDSEEYKLVDSDGKTVIFNIDFDITEEKSEKEFYTTFLKTLIDDYLEPQYKDNNFIFYVKKNDSYILYKYDHNDKIISKRMGGTGMIYTSINLDQNTIIIDKNNEMFLKKTLHGGRRRHYRNYRGNGNISELVPVYGEGLYEVFSDPTKIKTEEELDLIADYVKNNIDKLKIYIEINNNEQLKNFIDQLNITEYLQAKGLL